LSNFTPLDRKDFDVVIVGSGPNGLSAGIVLQQAGLSSLIIEGSSSIGGGLRSAELTLPGYLHDICSAIHPFAAGSPFFKTLPLNAHGLEYIYPDLAAAHPFDDGTVAFLASSMEKTAFSLGQDAAAYQTILEPIKNRWPLIGDFVMNPLQFPTHPLQLSNFCFHALLPASKFVEKYFRFPEAKGFFAGMAAHSAQPLTNWATSAVALVLILLGHDKGWPIPKGGSGQIAKALGAYYEGLGGKIETNNWVRNLDQLPSTRAILLDVSPRQLLQIAGHRLSALYKWQLNRYRYGLGVFKIDWALDGPIPFKSPECSFAGTLHLGNSFEEIAAGEKQTWTGKQVEKPFVILAQQSLFDPTRAPKGKQVAWAYCHVPSGSAYDMTVAIEKQVERFAPGFRDLILARHVMNNQELENYNPNNVGGDIGGGVQDISQLFTRPALRFSPYRSSAKGIYLCSSSTPPGGGVHGMCGYHAARRAIKDIFTKTTKQISTL
jgi:phytoene dehydrogenase-like protein